MIWSLIVKFLSGNIIGRLFDAWAKSKDVDLAKYQTSAGVSGTVVTTVLQTEAASTQARFDLLKGLWITQWLIALALLPPIVHSGLVYIDSSCPASWGWGAVTALGKQLGGCGLGIEKAPAPYDDREWLMISALLGISSGVTLAASLIKGLARR